MLKELKFVQGAVAKKDLLPAMTHFRIERGTVRSYNGTMALSSPIALDLDCCPKASAMVQAIANCDEEVMITMTAAGRLSIRSGSFRALVPTIEGETPHVEPAGEPVVFDGEELMKALRIMEPFIGTDASRPFTNGILFDGQSAWATNNVCIVQYWMGTPFPISVNLPRAAIKELLRVGEAPIHAQVEPSSMTFHYTDGRWIRTQLLTDQWPMDKVNKLLDAPSNPLPLSPELFTGLRKVQAMADEAKRVYLKDGALRTSTQPDEGAMYELDLPAEGCYNMEMLGLLEGVVTSADFTLYPGPCLFFGERLRGAIIGMLM